MQHLSEGRNVGRDLALDEKLVVLAKLTGKELQQIEGIGHVGYQQPT